MTEQRAHMIREMTLRGFSPRAHKAYLGHMINLVRRYRRPADQITNEEVRQYLAHLLMERKVSWSSCNQAACAFRFFYHATLGRSASEFEVPAPRSPRSSPRSSVARRCGG